MHTETTTPAATATALGTLSARIAGLASLAADTNAQARAARYHFAKMSHAEQYLLLQLLKFVGCGDGDDVYLALVEHMQGAEQRRARARTRARRQRREER